MRRARILRVLSAPEVFYGSQIREFRVRVGVSVNEAARALGYRTALRYLRDIEDPPRGMRAVDVRRGHWWTPTVQRRAQEIVTYLWERAYEADRRWLRSAARR